MPDDVANVPSAEILAAELRRLSAREPSYATTFVEQLLAAACARGASDVHLTPYPKEVEIRWRVDGVLESLGMFPVGETTDIVARLKVLAGLLTYRQETPQEGRLRTSPQDDVEMRVSTFPTLFGERAVVRVFPHRTKLQCLADLQFPADLETALRARLASTSGAIIVTGPAGSGKTTTVYACLRELLRDGVSRSIVTLEDPIECVLPGAAQSAIQSIAGFDFATALRSLMRQDPEVILVGEVRDRETAVAAFQAALTGHLLFTTFHAGSACGAISRLSDMGIEPYVLRSGLQMVVGQRLVRKLCSCATESSDVNHALGMKAPSFHLPQGCLSCAQTGYAGRLIIAEMLPKMEGSLASAVLAREDAKRLEAIAVEAGMITLAARGLTAVATGQTSLTEIQRVLGIGCFSESVTD